MADDRHVLSSDRINLERVNFLLVDDNLQALDIIGSAISGFGVRNIIKCQSVKDARDVIRKTTLDFIVTDAQMPGENGYDLMRWIRFEAGDPNRFVPAIICTGHTRLSQIILARDCGAHFIVAKPITPKILLERIFWVAREERAIIDSEGYVGPDRRFKRLGPPQGVDGRRRDDLSGQIGQATEPNLSQDEINSFMKPAKVAI
jgi:DNA-binding response OmpR family regulator